MKGENTITHPHNNSITRGFSNRLIIFTRYPEPGSAKTRLIPTLGAEGAADLQKQMTEHTLETMKPLSGEEVELQVRFEGGDPGSMIQWLGEDLLYSPQGSGDLGERMKSAFTESFTKGFERAVVIGTDCPSLKRDDVVEAFDLLKENSLVIGPATDGGYYLIGIRSDSPDWLYELVFENVPWGTDQVFNVTVNALAETGLDLGLLDEKPDVDKPEDLEHWENEVGSRNSEFRFQNKKDLTISVVVPTLNEEERIGDLIRQLKKTEVEVVVADGGSADRTVQICEEAAVKIVKSQPGRAHQMNAGASAASGNVFLFLHADTRLPDGFEDTVKSTIIDGAVAGAFLFGADMGAASMGVIENAAHFRTYRMSIVFGDQAIFTTREAFFRAGAYPEQPIMEDYELWRRLGRVGKRSIVPLSVITSTDKWRKHGVWKTTVVHQVIMWLYLLGVSPERLARWYKGKMENRENGRRKEEG